MEVSHFELIFKPQSPSSPPGANVDRVIQGYFLEITNLEETEYLYGVEFIAIPPPATTPNQAFRSLAGNTLVFVDTPGNDNQIGTLSGGLAVSSFRPSTGLIRIAPKATALVAVLPSAFGPNPIDPTPLTNPLFEVRGFVRITLPALRRRPFFFFSQPQSTKPVRVLLTPQNRATFLAADNSISGQVQASLPTANGAALNLIPPEPGVPFLVKAFDFQQIDASLAEFIERNPEIERAEILAMLLGSVNLEESDLAAFNTSLAEADVKITIKPRK